MKKNNKLHALLLMMTSLMLSCHSKNNFDMLGKDLTNQNIKIDSKKDILVILYNKSECVNCNITISAVFNYTPLQKTIPTPNRCVLMKPVREIEKKRYNEQFDFLQPNPPKIYNQQIYDQLQKELGAEAYEGGIFIISPSGKTIFRSKMKNTYITNEIDRYINNHQ